MNYKRTTKHCRPKALGPTIILLIMAVSVPHGASAWGQANAANAYPLDHRESNDEMRTKITASFTVAAVGDIIEPTPLYSSDPRFADLIDHMRRADIGFANMESSLVNFHNFQGGVDGTLAPLEMGAAMKAMGITIVNRANNHTLNGGVEGMLSTDAELDKLGIVHAGTGRDLQEARGAAFQATPKGRVGLVGMYSTTAGNSEAGATYRTGDLGGRPGENLLHLTDYQIVSPDQLQQLQSISAAVKEKSLNAKEAPSGKGQDRFKFFSQWFQAGAEPDGIVYEMNPKDEKDILTSIRNGKVYADFMIATIHAHETTHSYSQGNGGVDNATPDFLVKLAHDCIDNGADMFIGHGVHSLRGIEIYKGRPIFYGISNFVTMFGQQFGVGGYDILANERSKSYLLDPLTMQTVLTTSRFEGGKLKEIRIYPADDGDASRPVSQIGIPLTPSSEFAQRTLKKLQDLSKPFGTTITIENNVGVIRVNDDGQSVAVAR
jgi:poly-gamma-glutamate capsule biosynthesis protein CapA/YwtB (metallophosphatase superfamily)